MAFVRCCSLITGGTLNIDVPCAGMASRGSENRGSRKWIISAGLQSVRDTIIPTGLFCADGQVNYGRSGRSL